MTRWTTTHGLTHCDCSVWLRLRVPQHQVKSCISTKLGHQATSIEYISYNLMQNGSGPCMSKPSLSESSLSESFLCFLVVIGCGVCSVFLLFLGSCTSVLAWPDRFTKCTNSDCSVAMVRSWSNAKMRVLKSLWYLGFWLLENVPKMTSNHLKIERKTRQQVKVKCTTRVWQIRRIFLLKETYMLLIGATRIREDLGPDLLCFCQTHSPKHNV